MKDSFPCAETYWKNHTYHRRTGQNAEGLPKVISSGQACPAAEPGIAVCRRVPASRQSQGGEGATRSWQP